MAYAYVCVVMVVLASFLRNEVLALKPVNFAIISIKRLAQITASSNMFLTLAHLHRTCEDVRWSRGAPVRLHGKPPVVYNVVLHSRLYHLVRFALRRHSAQRRGACGVTVLHGGGWQA